MYEVLPGVTWRYKGVTRCYTMVHTVLQVFNRITCEIFEFLLEAVTFQSEKSLQKRDFLFEKQRISKN